uniref:Putative adp-ribosylation factor-like 6 n=1 Tax=Rhipicephalus pulchellus TaxID=72859 RepID=L7LTB8_RHIPC
MDNAKYTSQEQDQAKKLRLKLEGWREVVLPLHSVLLWNQPYYPGCIFGAITREVVLPLHSVLLWSQPYYPGCIFGAITTVFLLLWYLEPSLLTTFSLIGMLVCLLDYLVPLLLAQLCSPDKWTSQHERQLHDICLEAVHAWQSMVNACASLKKAKQEKPKAYVVAVLISLLVMAWIGNAFDNLFLTYLIVLFLAMTPGMKHHGIFKKYFSATVLTIRNLIADKMKKN